MPAPASVSVAHGRLSLDSSFNVSTVKFTDGRLERAIDRMLHRLADRSGLTLSRKKNQNQTAHSNLLIYTEAPGMQVQGIEEDESYTLETTPEQATLRATTVVGALRGLETFLQLVSTDSQGVYLPIVKILDHPRFPWRGLLLDVSRHFFTVDQVKHFIDLVSLYKLNRLHLHLSILPIRALISSAGR